MCTFARTPASSAVARRILILFSLPNDGLCGGARGVCRSNLFAEGVSLSAPTGRLHRSSRQHLGSGRSIRCALKGHFKIPAVTLRKPYRLRFHAPPNPGRRCALPWATMTPRLQRFGTESSAHGERGLHVQGVVDSVLLRCSPGSGSVSIRTFLASGSHEGHRRRTSHGHTSRASRPKSVSVLSTPIPIPIPTPNGSHPSGTHVISKPTVTGGTSRFPGRGPRAIPG